MKRILIFISILFLLACSNEQKKVTNKEIELHNLYTQILKKNLFTKKINQTYREIIKQTKEWAIIDSSIKKEIPWIVSLTSNCCNVNALKKDIRNQKKELKNYLVSLYIYDYVSKSTNTMSSNVRIKIRNTHWQINRVMDELATEYSILYLVNKKGEEKE